MTDNEFEAVKLVLMSKKPVVKMEQLCVIDPSQDVSIQESSSMCGDT